MDRLGDGLVYLCRASGEGSHDFRVCHDEAGVGAFYQEMTGEDEGGGIDSLWRDFRNPDCWGDDGTALELELYCAKFEVWKVDARQLNCGARVDGVDVPHASRIDGLLLGVECLLVRCLRHGLLRAEVEAMLRDVAAARTLPSATTPIIRAMKACQRHEGIPFTFTAYAGTVATYCPHCEAESAA